MQLLPDTFIPGILTLGAAFIVGILCWDLGRFKEPADETLTGFLVHLSGWTDRTRARWKAKLRAKARESRKSRKNAPLDAVTAHAELKPASSKPHPVSSTSSWRRLLDPRMWFKKRVRVVIIGMTGAGKSTLGNLLVFGEQYPEEGGFEIGHGMDSHTAVSQGKTCRSSNCQLTVYDTPGVPDTNRDKTWERFDDVIRTVRRLPALNAVIFLFDARRHEANDYEAYRVLLAQFIHLPCPLILVSRVDSTNCPKDVRQMKEDAARDLISRIREKCGLESKRVRKVLLRHGNFGEHDVNWLRFLLGFIPGVFVAREMLMSSRRMKWRLCRLCNRYQRIEELEKEVTRLRSVQKALRIQIAELDHRLQAKGRGITVLREIAALIDFVLRAPVISSTVAHMKREIFELKWTKKITKSSLISTSASLDTK